MSSSDRQAFCYLDYEQVEMKQKHNYFKILNEHMQ